MRKNDIIWLKKNLEKILDEDLADHHKETIRHVIITLIHEDMVNQRKGQRTKDKGQRR